MSKILFISPYPPHRVASQRFRFEQYLSQLTKNGVSYTTEPFFSEEGYRAFYQRGNLVSKIRAIVHSYVKRYLLLLRLRKYTFIFIHREATPLGPPIIEWVIAKVLRKKIIYDFDDAIWLTDNTSESRFEKFLRWRRKVASVCRWSYRVSCGNGYLAEYARQFNTQVVVNPTTIDTDATPIRSTPSHESKVTIGWTGSYSTLKYFRQLVPTLQALHRQYPAVDFIVIADQDPVPALSNYHFIRWAADTEKADLLRFDIGIMPLPDDPWTKGKCGFKALQYMAIGIPAVVSPVGANCEIVRHDVEGYWSTTPDEWFSHLEALILDPDKRLAMGKRGRERVERYYSLSANKDNFLSLFE